MALSQPLTIEIIHKTASDLQDEGIRPTLANVRDRLGGGSFSTISQAMQSWKQDQQATAQLEKVVIPDDINNKLGLFGAELWETAQNHANEQLSKEREALAHKEALLVAEVEDFKKVVVTLEAEQSDLTDQLDQLNAQLDTANALVTEQLKQIDELNKSNIKQGNDLQTLTDKLTAERDKSAQLQDKLDQLTAQVTALTGDNARLTADLAHAKADNDRLNGDLSTIKADHKTALDSLATTQKDLATMQGKYESLLSGYNEKVTKETDYIQRLFELNGQIQRNVVTHDDQIKRIKALEQEVEALKKPVKTDQKTSKQA